MIKSMTGYGKAEAVLMGRKFTIEMKSVNHRFLEISLRLPGMLLPLEGEIKKRIGEQFSRGRIEATLRVDSDGNCGDRRPFHPEPAAGPQLPCPPLPDEGGIASRG